jgi:hypothetical protein
VQKRSADIPVGQVLNTQLALATFRQPAGWKARETADKNVCATVVSPAMEDGRLPPGCASRGRMAAQTYLRLLMVRQGVDMIR